MGGITPLQASPSNPSRSRFTNDWDSTLTSSLANIGQTLPSSTSYLPVSKTNSPSKNHLKTSANAITNLPNWAMPSSDLGLIDTNLSDHENLLPELKLDPPIVTSAAKSANDSNSNPVIKKLPRNKIKKRLANK